MVGDSGTGKSTLINSLRGLTSRKDARRKGLEWAKTAATEQTMTVSKYDSESASAKSLPLSFFDHPGQNTRNFPVAEYVQQFGLRHYDMVLLTYHSRLYATFLNLYHALKKAHVPVFLIRTKIDTDVAQAGVDAAESGSEESEEELAGEGGDGPMPFRRAGWGRKTSPAKIVADIRRSTLQDRALQGAIDARHLFLVDANNLGSVYDGPKLMTSLSLELLTGRNAVVVQSWTDGEEVEISALAECRFDQGTEEEDASEQVLRKTPSSSSSSLASAGVGSGGPGSVGGDSPDEGTPEDAADPWARGAGDSSWFPSCGIVEGYFSSETGAGAGYGGCYAGMGAEQLYYP